MKRRDLLIIFFGMLTIFILYKKRENILLLLSHISQQEKKGHIKQAKTHHQGLLEASYTKKPNHKQPILPTKKFGCGFTRMIPLIEASQKAKDLERLYFVQTTDSKEPIEDQTIRDLIKSLAQERAKLRRHLDNLKAQTKESTTTRSLRSLAYYIRVLEESIQDMEGILINRITREKE